jgi:two-component system sensor histidine kinase/response regulator
MRMCSSNGHKTLLIIEDSPELIDNLRAILEIDYTVQVATDGKTGLEIIRSARPNLVLLDIMLPDMDGFAVAREIRRNPALNNLPVLFLTALNQPSDIVRGFEAGGQDYLCKPFYPRELLARIRAQLCMQEQELRLQEMNEELERQVSRRTAQLERANAELARAHGEVVQAHERLQHLDLAKSRFLKIISHEMRTPLTGILGITELLSEPNLNESEFREFMVVLRDSAHRLESFAKRALYITRIQLDKKLYERIAVNGRDIHEMIEMDVMEDLRRKNQRLDDEIPADMSFCVEPMMFRTALENVMENAVIYAPEGALIRISYREEAQWKILLVENEGSLFSEEALQLMFQFFAPGREPVDQDMGLGLATVKLIMDAHDGELRIHNSRFGATVELLFPANVTDQQYISGRRGA